MEGVVRGWFTALSHHVTTSDEEPGNDDEGCGVHPSLSHMEWISRVPAATAGRYQLFIDINKNIYDPGGFHPIDKEALWPVMGVLLDKKYLIALNYFLRMGLRVNRQINR